jgi:transcriptional regulator with XRE-family HTH domain
MNLEDHLGDIIRKGRLAGGVEAAAAAQAAGLSVSVLTALEESGQAPPSARLANLAAAIGLDGPKLESIARGWRPAVPNLENWREVRQIITTANDMSVHCYLVWDEVLREAALFDTGWEAAPIFQLLEENGLILRHIFLTGRGPREISQSPPAHQFQKRSPATSQPPQRFHPFGQPSHHQSRHPRPCRRRRHLYYW